MGIRIAGLVEPPSTIVTARAVVVVADDESATPRPLYDHVELVLETRSIPNGPGVFVSPGMQRAGGCRGKHTCARWRSCRSRAVERDPTCLVRSLGTSGRWSCRDECEQ